MKRLYYLTPSLDSAEKISTDLHFEGIRDWNFHVHCKNEAGLYKRQVLSSNYIQKLDLIRFWERGAMLGFVVALIVIAYFMVAQPFSSRFTGLAYLTIFGFITLFGGWVGGLVGIENENQTRVQYRDAIEHGKYLVLIDVLSSDEENVINLMNNKHPEAQFKRVGSTMINPFKFKPAAT